MESKQTVHIAYWKFLYPTQHKHNIKQNKTKQNNSSLQVKQLNTTHNVRMCTLLYNKENT